MGSISVDQLVLAVLVVHGFSSENLLCTIFTSLRDSRHYMKIARIGFTHLTMKL